MSVSAPEALSREHAMLTRLLLAIDSVVNSAQEDRNTAHAAWEETVIFPAMYDFLPERDMDDINEKFIEAERRLLGNKGPVEHILHHHHI